MKIKFWFPSSFFFSLTHLFSNSFSNEQNANHQKISTFFNWCCESEFSFYILDVFFILLLLLLGLFVLYFCSYRFMLCLFFSCWFLSFRLILQNTFTVNKLVSLSIFLFFYTLCTVLWRLFIRFSLVSSYLPHWIYNIYSILYV